jgi:hypothetical protein
MMITCELCGERTSGRIVDPDMVDTKPDDLLDYGKNGHAHRCCMLRNVLGGIGHLTDHAHWCVQEGDCDGGLTYFCSALAVWGWVHAKAGIA